MATRGGIYCVVLILFGLINEQISGKRFIQFLEEPTDITVLRNKLAELKCNVSGDSNTKITWIKDGSVLDLTGDTRRTILPHGSLKFSTIMRQKKKGLDDGVYQCVATNTNEGNVFKLVSRKARLTVVGMSKSFSESPSNMTVKEGETAFFRCRVKRSRPPAKITWSMEGKNTDLTLNFRFVVLPSGILEIRSVMASDAGVYVCKATNVMTRKSVTAKAVLTVKPASTAPEPSQFLVKPKNVTILHNNDMILECIVTGYPKPRVIWRKDGRQVTISGNGRYTQFGTDNLRVSAVQPSDRGLYECVIGSSKAVALVQVLVPPRFTTRPRDMMEQEATDITLKCDATGYPVPKITWYYNGKIVEKTDYIKITNNSLKIEGIMDIDQGIYQCFARNDGGEIQASAQLTVLLEDDDQTEPPTTILTTVMSTKGLAPGAPKNVIARTLSTTSVVVSWRPPDNPHGVITNYTVVITDVNAGSLVPTMPSTTETLLSIDNLKPGTIYSFVVFASNKNGKGSISRHATAQTKPLPPSSAPTTGPPRDVKVIGINSKALKVTWKEPSFIATPIQNYTVEYQDADRNTPARTISSMKLEAVLLKLQIYTRYDVRVTAVTTSGPGKTSVTKTGRTKSGIPKGPPTNVQLSQVDGSMLVAHWSKPFHPNGNITGYIWRLKNVNTGVVNTSTTHTTGKIFRNVEKSATYAFKVAAETDAGRGEFSKWKKIVMPPKAMTEDILPGKPTNLRVRVLQGMLKVTWDPPAEKHIVVRKYVLNYGKGVPWKKDIPVPNTTTHHLLKNLQPGATYIIEVRAANKNGQGKEALEKVDIPPIEVRVVGLQDFRAIPVRKRTLKLSWKDSLRTAQPVVSYNIRFEKDNEWQYINTTRRTHIVEDLRAGTKYMFYIKRSSQANYSKSPSVANSTWEEVPSVPKDVTVIMEAEQGHVRIQWNIPDEQNGQLKSYKICWKPKNVNNWTCIIVKGDRLNQVISGIKDNVTYLVKISAENSAGEGGFSKPEEFNRSRVQVFTTSRVPVFTTTSKSGMEKKKVGNDKILTSGEKTLWIVIAVIAAVTLIAIVVISVILCKKRSRGGSMTKRKPSAETYKAVANGGAKKKGAKDNYWIRQNSMEMEPFSKGQDSSIEPTIPRNAEEMKPLDSPFQSRKNQNSLLMNDSDQESLPPDDHHTPSSFTGDDPSPLNNPHQPLPKVATKPKSMKIYESPFPHEADEFPAPPAQEVLDNKDDDGPATSSDYGSEEIVAPSPSPDQSTESYTPKKTPNGYVSVATDYDYSPKEKRDSFALQNLMRDLDAIMAKEDRV